MRVRNSRNIINSHNNLKNNVIILKTCMKKILFCIIISIIFSLSLLLLPMPKNIEAHKAESEIEEMCISYNKLEKLISITCKYANFADVSKKITDHEILKLETPNVANKNNNKVWLLNSGLKIEKMLYWTLIQMM